MVGVHGKPAIVKQLMETEYKLIITLDEIVLH